MGQSRIVRPSAVHRQGGLRASPETQSYTLTIHTRLSPVTFKSLQSPQRPYVHPLATPPSPLFSLPSLPSSPTRSHREISSSSASSTSMPPLKQRRLDNARAPLRQLNTSRSPVDLPHTPTPSPVSPVAKAPALPRLPSTPTSPTLKFSRLQMVRETLQRARGSPQKSMRAADEDEDLDKTPITPTSPAFKRFPPTTPTSPTLKVSRLQKVRETLQRARESPQESTRVADGDEDLDKTPTTPTSPVFKRFPPTTPTSPTPKGTLKLNEIPRRGTAQKVGTARKASKADENEDALEERVEKALAAARERRRSSATRLPFVLRSPDAQARRQSLSSPLSSPTRSPRKAVAEEQPHPQPQPGPFQLLEGLESGAFGKTLAARDLSTRRVVCLKVFEKARVQARRHVHALRRELVAYQRVAGSDECLWVMQIHAAFQTDEKIYFVMDLMDHDLLEAIGRGITKDQARKWMAQISTGIQALHDMGVMHRDVKPENILIDYQGSARLADLGTAHVHSHPLSPNCTYTSEYVGTPPYMAPELVSIGNLLHRGMEPAEYSLRYGVQVDWWALGCVFWDMLTGESLFQEQHDLKQYIEMFRKGQGVQYLRSRAPDMTQWEERLLAGLLDVNEDRRFLFHDIRLEGYFKRNGLNEFDNLTGRTRVSRSLYRPEKAHYQLCDTRDLEVVDLFETTRERTTRLRRLSYESDSTTNSDDPERTWRRFAWISPKGMWSDWAAPEKLGF